MRHEPVLSEYIPVTGTPSDLYVGPRKTGHVTHFYQSEAALSRSSVSLSFRLGFYMSQRGKAEMAHDIKKHLNYSEITDISLFADFHRADYEIVSFNE